MKKILIVEDNRQLTALLKEIIGEAYPDCEFIVCTAQREAMTSVTTDHSDFDLMFLDGTLDIGHGRYVLEALTSIQVARTIIFSAENAFMAAGEQAGVKAFLDKDFSGIPVSEIGDHVLKTIRKIKPVD